MPNYVTNKIEFQGKKNDIETVLELIAGEDEYIDFDKIVPSPDYIYQGDLGPEERKLYGENNWYDWNRRYWGTKWNAFSSCLEEYNVLIFETAWTAPIPVFEKLAQLCQEHNVDFIGKWADEDCGSNTGVFSCQRDDDTYYFDYECMEDSSDDAYDIYVELNGAHMCIGKDENGHWTRYECDTCPNKENC